MIASSYRDYFRRLAILHKDLAHDPASESPDARDARLAFSRFDEQEVLGALRTKVGTGPVMLLHRYEWMLRDEGYSSNNVYKGGFLVTQHGKPTDTTSQTAAEDATEAIVNDIIERMRADMRTLSGERCALPFGTVAWNTLQVTPVGPIWDSRFGWFCSFQFTLKYNGLPDRNHLDNVFSAGPQLLASNEAFLSDTGTEPAIQYATT